MDKYTEEEYCPFCLRFTEQEFYDSGHERDSSGDYVKCLTCGAFRCGFSNNYELNGELRDELYGFYIEED